MKVLKKVLLGVLSLACVFATAVGWAGCEDGKDGKDGKSAYDIWLENGHSGTEADFLEWLKGDAGTQDGKEEQEGTDGLAYYPLPDGTYAVGQGTTTYLNEIVIPTTYKGKAVTTVAENGFENSKLQSITIPDSVSVIGDEAFSWCESLTNVKIGNGLTNIADNAFYKCSNMTNVYITDIAAWCNISGLSNLMFYGSSNKNLYLNNQLVTELVIPDGVTAIVDGAFDCFVGLTSVAIPNSVTNIGKNVFAYCRGLTSVVIPDSVSVIGDFAFQYCIGLTSVVIGDSVASIGFAAFAGCSSLTSIVLSDQLTSIVNYAFNDCSRLTEVYYKGVASEWGEISIGSNNAYLTEATRYYYSESQPTEEGDYWHYDRNGEIVIW